ncbi:MFS transporter [Arthrobacter sp. CJ23]|uniref:MFS transporter n=1 Tax=Arthrobacter sp. CJ23 TaxID=2972479 RepID=UPI00215BFBDE|nr:MFS transporter [Arthrobacter sp. CJ23]UVJ38931.1 MFS transporter [Arthrobacter sp. CJ23]
MPTSLTFRRPPASGAAPATAVAAHAPGPALAVALLGFFVITLDALVVNVALPVIGQELGGGMTGLQWVLDSYTLMFAALLLFGGTLSDRIGARQGFGAGLLVFVAASAACALAPSLGWLVAARFLQGAGAALMMPASLALIREAFPDPVRRARAIAVWSVGGAVASAAGPVLGGFLALSSWRSIFFINLPVGLLALFLLSRIPRSPGQAVPFDWTGQATAILGMGALTYGVIEGGAVGFDAPQVLLALGIATAALLAFLLSQSRGSQPMLPLDMFRSRPVAVSMSVGFAFTVAFYGMVFLLSLYLQQDRGLSALETGLVFLPMTALVAFSNLLSARIAARYGPKVPIAVGQALMAAGLLAIALAAAEAPTATLAVLMIPVGLGGSLSIPPMTAVLLDSVPARRAGAASGGLNTCRQLGGALAIAVFGTLIAHHGFPDGLRISLLAAVGLLILTTAASLTLRPSRRG